MNEAIVSLISGFRIQDFFDIFIITSLIYLLLIWFKTTASRLVFVGISLMGGIYILARLFNLYLTTLVLQSFFTILIIALVVIFQEDIRRFFERIATLRNVGKTHRKADKAHDSTIEAIIESVADFASKRIGAIIVIQGQDPLERHLKGGNPLDGLATKPLLLSIFDVHSIGHDGAVIINHNRIEKFGCHLPLSMNTEKIGEFGLRHTAALGLSERCDALCIVISEEKGTITVVLDGEIRRLKNAAELRTVIEKYYEDNLPEQGKVISSHWFRQNTMEKALALVLALGLWFVFGYQKDMVQRDYIIPIEYRKISQDWEIEESRDKDATITLMGSSQAFSLFDAKNLKISIDLSSLNEGRQTIKLLADMVNMPSNLTLVKINPDRIIITAHRLYPRVVSVHIDTMNRLPEEYELKKISVTPEKVTVLAPFSLLGNKIFITTEPIDLSEITVSRSEDARIVYPTKVRFKNNQVPLVRVDIEVEKKKK
ncbi:MAG: diadenylate cyclase [Syntrophaceae bacterium]|nr:diadenylate cyclase [Deltaproteobacteria bacterium]